MQELVAATLAMARATSTAEVVRAIRDTARSVVGCDGITIVLRDGEMCWYVDEDAIGPLWKGKRFPLSSCISGWVMQHHELISIPEIYADSRIPHDAYRPTFVRSLAMAPIGQQSPIGAVGAYWASPHVPSPDELERLQALADSAAVALQNVHLTEELIHSRRLEALGRLAGGVAHDLNNLLTVVLGNSEYALSQPGLPPETQELFEDIAAAANRAGAITRQLLAFSRKRPLNLQPLSLNPIVDEILRLVGRLIGEQISISTHLDPSLPRIAGDRAQLEQIILNLAINAGQAMPAGGTLTVDTERTETGAALVVSDTGIGMDEETKRAIFEPFFTKRADGGTGLGLATVYGIVIKHGGSIRVDSAVGRGTTFRIEIPAAAVSVTEPAPGEALRTEGEGERVLVVEDEAQVRKVASILLREHGYEVVEAADVQDAWERARSDSIDLLLADVILPGGSGRVLYERLRKQRPELRVVYMSGYAHGDLQERGLEEAVPVLTKPFSTLDLLRAVRTTLDRPATR